MVFGDSHVTPRGRGPFQTPKSHMATPRKLPPPPLSRVQDKRRHVTLERCASEPSLASHALRLDPGELMSSTPIKPRIVTGHPPHALRLTRTLQDICFLFPQNFVSKFWRKIF